MKPYDQEIEDEAIAFILDNKDAFLLAVMQGKEFDRNQISCLDSRFDEEIQDRSYCVDDAIYILQNCENEDDGFGGHDNWQDDLIQRAACSFANDVWFKTEAHYNRIKDVFESLKADEEAGDDLTEATQAFNVWEDQYAPAPIKPLEKGSDDERLALGEWLWLNKDSAGMRGGYPLGSSYIDSRCGSGHGMPAVKEYVEYDHELAKKVPWLAGKRKMEVLSRFDELLDEHKRLARHAVKYRDIDKLFPPSCDITKVNEAHNCTYQDAISSTIWNDKRLSLADIREIARKLLGKAGDYDGR